MTEYLSINDLIVHLMPWFIMNRNGLVFPPLLTVITVAPSDVLINAQGYSNVKYI